MWWGQNKFHRGNGRSEEQLRFVHVAHKKRPSHRKDMAQAKPGDTYDVIESQGGVTVAVEKKD